MAKDKKEYSGDNIDSLAPVDQIRMRPGMWIGEVSPYGLFKEILDNSIDECTEGFCSNIKVWLSDDKKTVTVRDYGRGIPTDNAKGRDKPALTIIFTELFSGGKFNKEAYMSAGGLHGVGAFVVNALSKKTIVTSYRNGKAYTQEFSKGIEKTPLKSKPTKEKNGTSVTFTLDEEIFRNKTFTAESIRERLESLAYLSKDLKMEFEHKGKEEVFQTKGLTEFVETFITKKTKFFDPIYFRVKQPCEYEDPAKHTMEKGIDVIEAAIVFSEDDIKNEFHSYCNTVTTIDGGTHLDGFKSGLIIAMVEAGEAAGYKFTKDEVVEGMAACIHTLIPDPGYNSQSKDKLNTGRIEDIVREVTIKQVKAGLKKVDEKNLTELFKKLHASYEARMSKKDWRELAKKVRSRKKGQRMNIDNFSDCDIETPPEQRELFIVEGDSAKGTADAARDFRFQAVMAVQGKFTNAYRATPIRTLENKDINKLMEVLGCGYYEKCDITKIQYHKIIFAADADQDGMHIRSLGLALMNSALRPALEAGMVYVAEPPLFGAVSNKYNKDQYGLELSKTFKFANDKDELLRLIGGKQRKDGTFDTGGWDIKRYKGLGEANVNQLAACIFNPETRNIKRVEVNSFVEDDEYLNILMGDDSNYRKELLYGTAKD